VNLYVTSLEKHWQNSNGYIYLLPLSLAFDHRSCTGAALCNSRVPCCAPAASYRVPPPIEDLQTKQNIRILDFSLPPTRNGKILLAFVICRRVSLLNLD
jgi:hypothetical protein